ncbi:hypothetical protein DFH09DRAFT_1247212 [Mycena vulgaris]|nr:hypothetical protein DFH09DRAFT_1247212 [Mycena vulgaris]
MAPLNPGGRGRGMLSTQSDMMIEDTPEPSSFSADHGVYYVRDQRAEELRNVSHKKRRLNPTDLKDNLAQWIPVEVDPEEWGGGDAGPDTNGQSDDIDDMTGSVEDPVILGKRKKYDSSCRQCGEYLQCKECCVAGHATTPLHALLKVSLLDLGYIYQLGHGGLCCRFPDPRVLTMTVLEMPLIYRTFRLQNVVGNMNVPDFITAIERQTNVTASTGMDWVPHRYKEFMCMSRQWAFLMCAVRAGRLHDPTGIAGTLQRALAVICWACPHDGRNLPPDWRTVDAKFAFLYMLLVAVDANFKLKNRMRANEHPDPPLGPGWGYFVNPDDYRKHLKNYIPEKDISSCIAFAALLQKDTRGTAGLRSSGVGGCVCARHECVLPHGIGDLQKGNEMQSCQHGFHCARNITLQCALPVWHAASHEDTCQNANSLSFKVGVGKSDGEGMERTWSVLNPASYHTKDMGKGNWVDTLEDKIDSHNYLKNLGLGDALRRKLAVVRAERDRQVTGFKQISETIDWDVKVLWQGQIDEWLVDETKPNPYMLEKHDGPTEAQVCLELKKDEEKDMVGGKAPVHGTSTTAFLTAGLQIEHAQRRIAAELAGVALVAPDRATKIQEVRLSLLKKLGTFRTLQATFMLGASAAIQADEAERDSDSLPFRVEHIKLYMPSDLPVADRATACVKGLPEMEYKLRAAQCAAALTVLRGCLHAKRHLVTFQNEHVTGQVTFTKARMLIGQVGDRVSLSASKYRKGRKVLVALKGAEHSPHFKELKDEDIRLDGDNGESDSAAKKKLSMISAGRGARASRNASGQSKRLMSWIWTTQAGSGDDEQDLHDSVRVEWACAKARKRRWEEEVLLLQEEMRRTLRYLEWQGEWWDARLCRRPSAAADIRAGLRGYALKQTVLCHRLAAHFKGGWEATARVDLVAVMEAADLEQFFDAT